MRKEERKQNLKRKLKKLKFIFLLDLKTALVG